MIKLLEKKLLVKCRKEDLKLLKELKADAEKSFVEIMRRETGSLFKMYLPLYTPPLTLVGSYRIKSYWHL